MTSASPDRICGQQKSRIERADPAFPIPARQLVLSIGLHPRRDDGRVQQLRHRDRPELATQLRKQLMGSLIGNVEHDPAVWAAELDLHLISSGRPHTVGGDINLENRHDSVLPY
jgi:hypothetical protein